MCAHLTNKLVIALSSRALFDLTISNEIFEQRGIAEYASYQRARENDLLDPGPAFHLVKKLLKLNEFGSLVEVILLSRNSPDTGLRIFNSIEHHGLAITRAAFTSGSSPYQYLNAFGSHLFLSSNPQDVQQALKAGCAAATLLSGITQPTAQSQIRIAFDGDAVLFSDEAEVIFQQHGLAAFTANEQKTAKQPLPGGPFKGFLHALHRLQQQFKPDQCPLQTALITARQAPAHERVIRTLRTWNIRIDNALFLGGLAKSQFLNAFQADIFFDDQYHHCRQTQHQVTTGHVPHGITNNRPQAERSKATSATGQHKNSSFLYQD